MSALSDYCALVRRWIDDEDEYDDATVTEWIRDAEERMNNELRAVEQVVRGYATFDDECATLPVDWLEHIYVRLKGGAPFDYITPHDYWDHRKRHDGPTVVNTSGEVSPWPGKKQLYTTIGNTLFVWPPIDPEALTQIEICYFRGIRPMGDNADPILDRYPAIYRYCTLTAAAPYLVEDERLQTWAGMATAAIQKANEATRAGRWSGSPLPPRVRGFG